MDADEREIYHFLKQRRESYTSAKEICRRAGGKMRYRALPDWARPILARMTERGILESDSSGHYRLKPIPKSSTMKRWVSPQIASILRNKKKEFEEYVISESEMDDYYNKL
jgi:hypothetical protein